MMLILLPLAASCCQAAVHPFLSVEQYRWLGDRIFNNECNRHLKCLVHWNDGESFPSLGIGHFIWYAEGQSERFEETFPRLLAFLAQQGTELPDWLGEPMRADNPWSTRADFLAAGQSRQMLELHRLMQSTMEQQAAFIVRRFDQTVDLLLESVPLWQQDSLLQVIDGIAASSPPLGIYALIDYLHFKGSGLNPAEQYQEQGWGLKQVLLSMDPATASVDSFVDAATTVLTERVANAPAKRNEQRWLQGWLNRLHTYLPTD